MSYRVSLLLVRFKHTSRCSKGPTMSDRSLLKKNESIHRLLDYLDSSNAYTRDSTILKILLQHETKMIKRINVLARGFWERAVFLTDKLLEVGALSLPSPIWGTISPYLLTWKNIQCGHLALLCAALRHDDTGWSAALSLPGILWLLTDNWWWLRVPNVT